MKEEKYVLELNKDELQKLRSLVNGGLFGIENMIMDFKKNKKIEKYDLDVIGRYINLATKIVNLNNKDKTRTKYITQGYLRSFYSLAKIKGCKLEFDID